MSFSTFTIEMTLRTHCDFYSFTGLDVASITKVVVETIRCSGTEDIDPKSGAQLAQTTLSDVSIAGVKFTMKLGLYCD